MEQPDGEKDERENISTRNRNWRQEKKIVSGTNTKDDKDYENDAEGND